MKLLKLIFTISAFTFFSLSGSAQNLAEKDITMSKGKQNALIIEIEGSNKKTAEKVWKDFMKDYGKTKKEKDEFRTSMVQIPAISDAQNVNVFLQFEELKEMTRAYLWVECGDHFVNSVEYADESEGMEDLINAYHNEVRKKVVGEEVKDTEDDLKDLEKDMKKLQDKNKDYHKDIEKAKKKISEMERNIEQNLDDQEKKKLEIEAQKEVVSGVTKKLNSIGKGK